MNGNTIDVAPRDYGFGRLKLTERIFSDVESKAEAFFGRMIGLYDASTDFHTDIEGLDDLHKRANIFRTINIWVDNAPKMIRNAHARICGDFPGIGRDDVLDPGLDLDEVRRWADYEADALEVCRALHKYYNVLWGKDFVEMGMDLHFNVKSLSMIRQWIEMPSWEVRHITARVTETLAKEGFLRAYTEGEDLSRYRDLMIQAWESEERILLSVPASKRKEENLG